MIRKLLVHLLRDVHAGDTHLAWNHPSTALAPQSLEIRSPSFLPDGTIPIRFAGRGVGENISPILEWSPAPKGTAELVLIMEDPDAPLPKPFVHLIAYGINADSTGVEQGTLCLSGHSNLRRLGRNTGGSLGYMGPRALRGHGPHRYIFQLFALNRRLNFATAPSKKELLAAMEGAVIARGRLEGTFERK